MKDTAGTKTPASRMQAARDRAESRLQKRDGKYEEIVACAAELFAEHGYTGTKMSSIAEQVGMLGGSLYYYVSSKTELLYAVIERSFSSDYKTAIKDLTDPAEKLRALVRFHLGFSARNAANSVVYYRDHRHLTPDMKRKLDRRRDRYLRTLMETVTQAQEKGTITTALGPRDLVMSLLANISAVHYWWKPGHDLDGDAMADRYTTVLFDGLKASSGDR